MAAIEMGVDLSTLIDAVVSGNSAHIISVTRELLAKENNADVLISRVGITASQGDADGHINLTLAASAMLARMLRARPAPLDQQVPAQSRALPLFARAMQVASPALKVAQKTTFEPPHAFFPSEILDSGKSFNDVVNQAAAEGDSSLYERALLGLYGTGADYRTLQIRAYEAVATLFHNDGYPLIDTVRGFQLLDPVEWGKSVPALLHWLAPKAVKSKNATEPAWINEVRSFASAHSLSSIRTRLSAPKDENALALRQLILSDASTTQVSQGVYDAVLKGEASPIAVSSVIALAAADLLQRTDESNRTQFLQVAQGLLFASAALTVFRQVQDVEALNILYTSAAAVNALYKQVGSQLAKEAQNIAPSNAATTPAGGMIAVSQLEAIESLLKKQDVRAALATAQRYLNLGHDPRALFGTIGLVAALNDTNVDQGRSLQIVQATAEAFTTWPRTLASTNVEVFLQIALRAAAFGQRDTLLA